MVQPASAQRADLRYAHLRADGHTVRLERALAEQPELSEFDGQARVIGSNAGQTGFPDLAEWLVVRAEQVGTAEALSDLQAYLVRPTFPVRCLIAVGGIQ